MPDFERVRRYYDLVRTAPGLPPISPPELPSTDDKKAEMAYERELEEYNQKKDARRKRHEETSTTIRRVYYAILTTVLFCFSIMHGRKDFSFISTSQNVRIPVTDIEVGYTVFLLVAPSIIIGLTIYAHIFIEENRKIGIEHEERLATIFNMESISARFVSHVIFYWLPPLTLFYFAWEAQPLRLGGPILLVATVATAIILFVLQLRRTGRHLGRTVFFSLGFITVVSVCSLFYVRSGRDFSLDGKEITDQDLTIMALAEASLEGTIMRGVNLNEVDLRGANLSGAIITNSELNGSDLSDANLAGAKITNSELNGSDLSDANLTGATLSNVELVDANLTGAILSNATLLEGTQLDSASLGNARLDGADLTGALELNADQLDGACKDQFTRLPATIASPNSDFDLKSCDRPDNEVELGAAPVPGQIDEPGREMEYTFGIADERVYQIDVMAVVSAQNDNFDPAVRIQGTSLQSDLLDDNSGDHYNSRIISRLNPGRYSLTVTGGDGKLGSFSVKIGDWDGQSIAGLKLIKVPADLDIPLSITVDENSPVGNILVPPNPENDLTWIDLRNPQGRGIVITVRSEETSELDVMLFDATAAHAPIARARGESGQSIKCTLGLQRYLILAGSVFDRPRIEVTVKLPEESVKDVGNDCVAN